MRAPRTMRLRSIRQATSAARLPLALRTTGRTAHRRKRTAIELVGRALQQARERAAAGAERPEEQEPERVRAQARDLERLAQRVEVRGIDEREDDAYGRDRHHEPGPENPDPAALVLHGCAGIACFAGRLARSSRVSLLLISTPRR